MAVSAKRKEKFSKAVEDWLMSGANTPLADLRAAWMDIPKATFYRVVKERTLATGRTKPDGAIEQARKLAKVATDGVVDHVVKQMLPVAVSPAALRTVSSLSAVDLIEECIGHAREAITFCKKDDGSIRNLKGFLAASAHLRGSVDTMARVVERINDAQRINEILDAILQEVTAESQETAQRILGRIQRIMASSGL